MPKKIYIDYLLEQIKDHTGWIIGSITAICGSGILQIIDFISKEHLGCYKFWLLLNFIFFLGGISLQILNIYLTILFADHRIKNPKIEISTQKRHLLKITFHGSFIFTILGLLLAGLIFIISHV